MLWVPHGGGYTWELLSHDGQPSATFGLSVTPGNNSKGNYVELISGAALVNDCWFIELFIHANAVTTAARDTLLDIGVDEAGGTSYTVKIPDLLCSCAGTLLSAGAIYYSFPLFIKAGSSIAARAAVNNATVGTLRIFARVYGLPSRPEATKVGQFVRAFGIDSVNSAGQAVTPGGASEGAWTQIGAATAEPLWYWQAGLGINDATMSNGLYFLDAAHGDASNKHIIFSNQIYQSSNAEALVAIGPAKAVLREVAAGDLLYGRLQFSTTADSAVSMALYGVGG